ncbi:FAD-dependent oxidoreductase [Listeria seeligeri]|uniref:FAD-dependent oxidoreductase n=1 Tax=Listeria seeligeri TaxID=1640 RepID=UPI0010E39EAA|nr:FAD-dependent oxidoreductase [Listeria seeligeri]MBC1730898.1 FAD-dependent oxidoreductase [Listeria seeligeri]MBC1808699.1 FAD-dependent oxidoreductase [Listeria seeligeri]MBC1895122.1 FAD-dependent oxidoreductase [Listeria seeligeri]MBC1994461.1 FAD-dependent oxidoreductase [Listeria seeligeri]MBC2202759.1 FAD-dependent oxidoreductase [Listeria seeligeri]
MKIVIIGSVAAGTSVAAKARRNTEEAEIVVYDQDKDISYSVCGIPYYIGGEVESLDTLTPRNVTWFQKRYNIDIFTEHRVVKIHPEQKKLDILNLKTGETLQDSYDELVLAMGAKPVIPKVFDLYPEATNLFRVRNIQDAARMSQFMEEKQPKKALIVGGGFIGLEIAEQLKQKEVEVTIVQRSNQIMKHLDKDMAFRVQKVLEREEIQIALNTTIEKVKFATKENQIVSVVDNHHEERETDMVILAAGVEPNTNLIEGTGIKLGHSNAISVDEHMQTNIPHISAVGDIAESYSLITGKPLYRPLGSTANKMGRIAGDTLTGGSLKHRGILGTGIVRVFDTAVAYTGLTEQEALEEGIDVEVLYNIKPDKADYLGGKELTIKALADKKSGRILGAQIIGVNGVDKRIDILATAITFKATAADLFHLDLAYAPPFATTKDPVLYTGMALDNAVHNNPLITPEAIIQRQENGEKMQIIDTRSKQQFEKSAVKGAIHIPLAELREKMKSLDPNLPTITYCNKGVTGNAAQNILQNNGFGEVYNLSGGNKNYQLYLELIND